MWHVLSKYNREGNATFSECPTTSSAAATKKKNLRICGGSTRGSSTTHRCGRNHGDDFHLKVGQARFAIPFVLRFVSDTCSAAAWGPKLKQGFVLVFYIIHHYPAV